MIYEGIVVLQSILMGWKPKVQSVGKGAMSKQAVWASTEYRILITYFSFLNEANAVAVSNLKRRSTGVSRTATYQAQDREYWRRQDGESGIVKHQTVRPLCYTLRHPY